MGIICQVTRLSNTSVTAEAHVLLCSEPIKSGFHSDFSQLLECNFILGPTDHPWFLVPRKRPLSASPLLIVFQGHLSYLIPAQKITVPWTCPKSFTDR